MVGKLQTWRWAAPETFDSQCHAYDERADNYSYGIVVWEIATSQRPFEEYEAEADDFAIQNRVINANLRPSVPEGCDPTLAAVMQGAWNQQPSQRLSFAAAASMLAQALGIQVPPEGGAQVPARIRSPSQTPSSSANQLASDAPALFKFNRRVPTVDNGGVMTMIAVKTKVWIATSRGTISVFSSGGPVLGVMNNAHEGRVYALLHVGKAVWSAGEDSKLHVWSCHSPFERRGTLRGHSSMIRTLLNVQTLEANVVWSADVEGKVLVWNSSGPLTEATPLKGITPGQTEGLGALCQVEQQVWMATRKSIAIYDLVVRWR